MDTKIRALLPCTAKHERMVAGGEKDVGLICLYVRVRVTREADGEVVVKETVEPGTFYAEIFPGSGEVRAPILPECETGMARANALFPMVRKV